MRKALAAAAILLSLGAGVIAVSRPPSHLEISGHVYEADSVGRALTPVAGVVVSNDWDSTTATTNAQGEFRLRVRRIAPDEWMKFSARVGDKAGWQLRLGSLKPSPVEIVLNNGVHLARDATSQMARTTP
jgi:hypothetical protein